MQSLHLRNDTLLEIATFLVRRWSGKETISVSISDQKEVQTKLKENFSVTPETNIFKVNNIHLERFQKVCRVAWTVFSIIVFPIFLTNLLIKNVVRLAVLPALTMYDLTERKVELAYLQIQKVDCVV